MSILKKPYEISVWEDEWDSAQGKFVEKRLGIIGSDKMTAQCRAIEPNLSRNVNGVKKFSFKMYKTYVDTMTGEKTKNPFVDWLINERKVKLKYGTYVDANGETKDRWYDFVIKNVDESSSGHICSYQLEDALVQELSKNGYGVTLDAGLQNNLGNVEKLATFVMGDSNLGWLVDAEKIVEKVEEELIYVRLPSAGVLNAVKLMDQVAPKYSSGVIETPNQVLEGNSIVLAFYSSCTNKPHRFQFIYLPGSDNYAKEKVSVNSKRVIQAKDCQYYIEFEPTEYTGEDSTYGLSLPDGFQVYEKSNDAGDNNDTTISTWYRGERYGFAQQAVYVPLLERYCNIYHKKNGETFEKEEDGETIKEYYGYIDSEYNAPVFTQNLITGYEFKNKTGWIGAFSGGEFYAKDKVEINNVFGRFGLQKYGSPVVFISSADDMLAGNFPYEQNLDNYFPYLEFKVKGENSLLLNSGVYDNRTLIGCLFEGDKLAFTCKILNSQGADVTGDFDFKLVECSYNSATGAYIDKTEEKIKFSYDRPEKSDYTIISVTNSTYSKETFKNSEIRLKITPKSNVAGTYYIKKIELFNARYNDQDKLILLDQQGTEAVSTKINKQYFYFPKSALSGISTKEELTDIEHLSALSYTTYVPVYNKGAEKVRTVSAKESNYFNILQSIAETFQCWLDLEITRDSFGGITDKKIRFKNYAGKTNYAAFRYGVNLQDITRTDDSNNIVTKLIVKQNNNELAEGGFCTIARAPINPTGESYIYDFQYYQNRGLMKADDYVKLVYKIDGAEGADRSTDENPPKLEDYQGGWNLNGYYLRLRDLNQKILDESDCLSGAAQELVSYKAKEEVAIAAEQAAKSGLEETREDFFQLTGLYPDDATKAVTALKFPETSGEKGWNISNQPTKKEVNASKKGVSNTIYTIEITRGVYGKDASGQIWFPVDGEKLEEKQIFYCSDEGVSYRDIEGYKVELKGDKYSYSLDSGDKIYEGQIYYLPSEKASLVFSVTYTLGSGVAAQTFTKQHTRNIEFLEGETTASIDFDGTKPIDTEKGNVLNYLTKFSEYKIEEAKATKEKADYSSKVTQKQKLVDAYTEKIDKYTSYKQKLNSLFFSRYSRFIREGTWMSEEYVDNNKYYTDSQSVLYNSCFPQVSYTINTYALEHLPGYEFFNFELGDETFAEDVEMFGYDDNGNPIRQDVIISEIVENLDDPSKNINKVQTFKNQFQDLFQKITATTQQAQYNSGAYERGVAEADAINRDKRSFLQGALNELTDGIDIEDPKLTSSNSDGSQQMMIVDGRILFKEEDASGQSAWTVGLSSQGISANKITAGTLDTGVLQIMSGDDAAFKWDEYGITAFNSEEFQGVQSGFDETKFVRFDKHGIYGIDGKDGTAWHPQTNAQKTASEIIDEEATFALTWEGLKVTGNTGTDGGTVVARIGKLDDKILEIGSENKGEKISLMSFANNGTLKVGGWKVSQDGLENGGSPSGTGAMKSRTALPEVFLTSAPRQRSVKGFVSTEGEDDVCEGIVFKAGEQFMVSEEGKLYANSGVIANWTIEPGRLSAKGISLLSGNDQLINGTPVRLYAGGEPNGWKAYFLFNDPGDEDGQREVRATFQISLGGKEVEKEYHLWAKKEEPDPIYLNSNKKPILLKLVRIQTGNTGEDELQEYTNNYWAKPEAVEDSQNEFQLIVEPQEYPYYLLEDGSIYATKGKIGGLEIDGLSNTINDKLNAESIKENNFSWKFSPTEGLFMWNGNQPTDPINTQTRDAVFAIYNSQKDEEQSKYELSMRGHIEAESGSIGGWTIGNKGIYAEVAESIEGGEETEEELGTVGMYYGTKWTVGDSPVRFYAGKSDNTAKFVVTEDGQVYASNAQINAEGFTINGKSPSALQENYDELADECANVNSEISVVNEAIGGVQEEINNIYGFIGNENLTGEWQYDDRG